MFTRPHTRRRSHVTWLFTGSWRHEAQDSSRRRSGLSDSLFPLPSSPPLGFSRRSFTEYKVRMDACLREYMWLEAKSALVLLPGESWWSPLDLSFEPGWPHLPERASERRYERWGRAAGGRSSGLHCTKDPYCPNCSLSQEHNIPECGSCQCFNFPFFCSLLL